MLFSELDNDGSGDADYPADVDGCVSPDDDAEADLPVTPCTNGFDEDLDDELTDYPSDPDCSSELDFTEGNGLKKGQDPFAMCLATVGATPVRSSSFSKPWGRGASPFVRRGSR